MKLRQALKILKAHGYSSIVFGWSVAGCRQTTLARARRRLDLQSCRPAYLRRANTFTSTAPRMPAITYGDFLKEYFGEVHAAMALKIPTSFSYR